MAFRGQGSRQGLRALLQAHRPAAGSLEAAGGLLRSPLPPPPLLVDSDAGWRRGSLAAAAARPPAFARWHGSRAGARCPARGFAAAAGGEEPPGSGDDSSSEWLDSSDEEAEGEDSGSDEDNDEEEGDEAEAGDGGDSRPKAKTQLSADELARMELEDPLAYAVALSQDPDSGYGLPPLHDILHGDDEEAEERAARRESEEAMQKEIAESRVRKVDSQGRAYATGKRKTAIARVWLAPGDGVVTVNGRSLDAYFPDINWRTQVVYPFVVTDTVLMFDVNVMVQGGGPSGQAQAVRHGVAKALQAFDPEWRPALREHGLITRDPRAVERKKPGRAKARKSFQWVKR